MSLQAAKLNQSDLDNEFVVGGPRFYEPAVRRIDTWDTTELRLNPHSIRFLRLDGEIESDVSLLADSVFADGMQIVSAVKDKDDPEFDEAQEIAGFMSLAVSDTARPLVSVLKEMFKSAFYNGVKVGEIVLRYREDSQVNGKLVLDRINPKPIYATAFVTDRFFNILGLVGIQQPGQAIVSTGAISLTDEEIIPREKFLVLWFELEDNDPRGLSQIRAAYEAYCDKKTTREQWKEWRRTSAIPKKFGTTGPNAKPIALKNPDGSPVIVNGQPQVVSPEKGLMMALEGFANNSAITAPDGTKIEQLEVTGKGEQFEKHFKSCNDEMRKVILGDALVTGAADKDARAARESSKDISDVRKQALRVVVASAIKMDIFRLLTVVNYGADKAHLTPLCFLGDTEANDWAGDLTAAAGAGYTFAPEHLAQLDTQFGLEPRSEDQNEEIPAEPDPNNPASDEGENNAVGEEPAGE